METLQTACKALFWTWVIIHVLACNFWFSETAKRVVQEDLNISVKEIINGGKLYNFWWAVASCASEVAIFIERGFLAWVMMAIVFLILDWVYWIVYGLVILISLAGLKRVCSY